MWVWVCTYILKHSVYSNQQTSKPPDHMPSFKTDKEKFSLEYVLDSLTVDYREAKTQMDLIINKKVFYKGVIL